MNITFKMLFDLPFQELASLAIMDDIVLFLRLWPLWIIVFILATVFIIILKKI